MKLNKYLITIDVEVFGESYEDALDYVESAIDSSEFLEQDGIVSVNILEGSEEDILDEDEENDDGLPF